VVLYAPATHVMTITRAAAIVSGGALLVAWFAVAGSAPEHDEAPVGDRTPSAATSGPGSLAAEVEQQAVRLRARLAEAPAPHAQPRNPFSFGEPRAARARALASPIAQPASMTSEAPPPPALVLMGIAEEPSFEGTHRTAVIAVRPFDQLRVVPSQVEGRQAPGDPAPDRAVGGGGDEIYIVMEGQLFADRYKVRTIGVDAIELADVRTGGLRRLALR
jgi:hypothetical protein